MDGRVSASGWERGRQRGGESRKNGEGNVNRFFNLQCQVYTFEGQINKCKSGLNKDTI